MRKIIPAFIVLLLFSAKSCVYQSTDYYYFNVVPGEEPVLTFTSNIDTLPATLTDSVEIAYEAAVNVGKIYQIDFYFNDEIIYSDDTLKNSFWLNPSILDSAGNYTLDLNVYYSTNSGYLADILGIEAKLYEESWTFYYNPEIQQ